MFSARMLTEMLQRLPLDTVQIRGRIITDAWPQKRKNACYEVDVWDRGSFPKPDLPFPEDTVKLSGIPARPSARCLQQRRTTTSRCSSASI